MTLNDVREPAMYVNIAVRNVMTFFLLLQRCAVSVVVAKHNRVKQRKCIVCGGMIGDETSLSRIQLPACDGKKPVV